MPERSGPLTPTPDDNIGARAAGTPKQKAPFKEETLDTPHFENEDTEEYAKPDHSDGHKKYSPLEIELDNEKRSYSP